MTKHEVDVHLRFGPAFEYVSVTAVVEADTHDDAVAKVLERLDDLHGKRVIEIEAFHDEA